jgi:hypothetical protein
MDMAEVTDGAITVDTGIIMAGVEVMATIMAGGTIAITGDLTAGLARCQSPARITRHKSVASKMG